MLARPIGLEREQEPKGQPGARFGTDARWRRSVRPWGSDAAILLPLRPSVARFVGRQGNCSTWKSKSANVGDICAPFLAS